MYLATDGMKSKTSREEIVRGENLWFGKYWIGLNKLADGTTWKWSDGSPGGSDVEGVWNPYANRGSTNACASLLADEDLMTVNFWGCDSTELNALCEVDENCKDLHASCPEWAG